MNWRGNLRRKTRREREPEKHAALGKGEIDLGRETISRHRDHQLALFAMMRVSMHFRGPLTTATVFPEDHSPRLLSTSCAMSELESLSRNRNAPP